MRQLFWLLLGLVVLAVKPAVASIIYVSGDVSGTWSADTVIVAAEVRVPPGQTLIIQPGVEVLFQVYCKLIVDNGATLRAVGTPADSIRFDELTPDTRWHGIRFLSASNSSQLEYCLLTKGRALGSGEDLKGGAIYCSGSSPTISHNTISGNWADSLSADANGGGICCTNNSNPSIVSNTLSGNSAYFGGGGIYCLNSSPTISDNIINSNSALFGGGIFCFTSNPTISGNLISYNSNGVGGCGGGIYCTDSNPAINSNVIRHNASGTGGGLYLLHPPAAFQFNEISENSATGFGGGLYLDRISFTINKNTIAGNTAFQGGGIFLNSSHPTVINSILWSNTPQQIYPTGGSTLVVNYSDIQGSWTGTGNLNTDPLFVNVPQSDYHLQAGSLCINTGDPSPVYNDPDGSRADMGCYYYNQSSLVQITLNAINPPIQIPASGGSFNFNVSVANLGATPQNIDAWIMTQLPGGSWYGPLLGPINLTLPASTSISRLRMQSIPAAAPAGIYWYEGRVGDYPGTIMDTSGFSFTKLGSAAEGRHFVGDSGLGSNDWENTGEPFENDEIVAESSHNSSFIIHNLNVSPNPFNPTTVLSFQLPVASHVALVVYDVSGQLVATLVDGWRESGQHEVTFDGSALASGVYLYRLQADNITTTNKMILLK